MGVIGSRGLVSTLAQSKNNMTLGGFILCIYVLVVAVLCGLAGVMVLLRKNYLLAVIISGAGMLFASFITLPSFILLILSKDTFKSKKRIQSSEGGAD
jgi:hypothetical protein